MLHSRLPWWLGVLLGAVAAACSPGTTELPDASVPACTARYALARRRPEIVLLIDRSCAMRARIDAPAETASGPDDPRGRWGAVRDAIAALTQTPRASGWGLVLYPQEASACTEPAMIVEPGPGSAEAVARELGGDALDPFELCGAGASEVALEGALVTAGASEALGASGEPFVVVIASGTPSCGSTIDSLLAAAALTTELSTPIVVIALGPDAVGEPMLEAIAAAGRAPRPEGPPSYYTASTAAEVQEVLEGLLAVRQSCVLDLVSGPPGPDPLQLRVWVDGALVEPDADEGWSFSAGDDSIALNGTLCERLRAGELRTIQAAVGCDEPECVPREEACDFLDDDCDGEVDEDCL